MRRTSRRTLLQHGATQLEKNVIKGAVKQFGRGLYDQYLREEVTRAREWYSCTSALEVINQTKDYMKDKKTFDNENKVKQITEMAEKVANGGTGFGALQALLNQISLGTPSVANEKAKKDKLINDSVTPQVQQPAYVQPAYVQQAQAPQAALQQMVPSQALQSGQQC